jgi:hypothetical protein
MARTWSRTSTLAVAAVYAIAVLLLGAVFLASRVLDRPVEHLTKDPTEILDAPAYIGFLTSVATILWAATVTACLLAWALRGLDRRSAFLWSGLFVAMLMTDDVFRLHEAYYPALFGGDAEASLGVPQIALRAAYGLVALAYIWIFRDFVREHGAWLFLLGVGLFGLAAAIDVLMPHDVPFVREEASKFLGIVTWLVFYVRAALGVRGRVDDQAPATG